MIKTGDQSFINEAAIEQTLATVRTSDAIEVREILDRARALKGLGLRDVAVLASSSDPELLEEVFAAARYVKETIYGRRLVLFAPLYVSNRCRNECTYCAFRKGNTALRRRTLDLDEIRREVEIIVDQGHKRILLVSGESYPDKGFSYILRTVETIYSVKRSSSGGEIRRVNVNISPLSVDEFRQLKAVGIGTYQLFQETYHQKTYGEVHQVGTKRDYERRLHAMDRAMEAGIDDVGIGVLFGLYDWRFEVLALMQHIRHFEQSFGVGPHTISVPRIELASGSELSLRPPHPVSDSDFLKLVAIMRLAVPYTGIIMSTRETPDIRRETFALGVSQISAGSRTTPGGYCDGDDPLHASQFSLGDHRPLDEVIQDVAALGYLPSFCTACYRLGRTGQDFMDLAKPGDIKEHCDPNGLSTFLEYLIDYGSPASRKVGEQLIEEVLGTMRGHAGRAARSMLDDVSNGLRDVLC